MARWNDGTRWDSGARYDEVTPVISHKKARSTMAGNALPTRLDRLFALAKDMKKGIHDLEATLGIKQNTEVSFGPAIVAAEGAEGTYQGCRVAKKTANSAVTAADNAAKVFIKNSRRRLTKFFGESYSTEWAAAGWPENSTALPSTQAERYSLVTALKNYFIDNPTQASVDMDATAAVATTVETAINTARGDLTTAIANCGLMQNARDVAVQNLRTKMEGLITELDQLIADDDPRWHQFGLSMPSDPVTPEVPEGLVLIGGTPGTLLADWEDALRADRYRVYLFVVGVDTDFHAMASPVYDSDATIPALTTGTTVKVRVTSVNDAGESGPSVEVSAVVP